MTGLAARFERESGQAVAIRFGTLEQLRSRERSAAHVDVVILADEALDALAARGEISPASRVAIGRAGLGVAVRKGAPAPDVSSVEALRRTLLVARTLIHGDPAEVPAGRHAAQVIERLGLAETLKGRIRLASGNQILAPVGYGDVEVGLDRIADILTVSSVRLAGPLPPELQMWTRYGAALSAQAGNLDEGRAWLRFLTGAAARSALGAMAIEAD